MNTFEKVKEIIAETCEVDASEVTEQSAIGDFDSWDSMAQLQILNEVEDAFDISFDPEDLMDLEDVNDIVKAVEAKKA